MTRRAILTLLALPLLALAACANIRKEPGLLELVTGMPEVRLRVLSFNIRFDNPADGDNRWEKRRELVATIIREQRPDIVGLQEALHDQIQDLLAALPEYEAVGVGRDDGATRGEYSPILFRRDRLGLASARTFWLSPTPDIPGSRGWGARLPRICTTATFVVRGEGRALNVFNTHLDHESEQARRESAHLIASAIAADRRPDRPVILTGDFNEGERGWVISYLTGRAETAVSGVTAPPSPRLLDTFRILSTQTADTGTYHGFTGNRTGDRIDFVLVDRAFKVVSAEILHPSPEGSYPPYPSDHAPVAATLSLTGVRP